MTCSVRWLHQIRVQLMVEWLLRFSEGWIAAKNAVLADGIHKIPMLFMHCCSFIPVDVSTVVPLIHSTNSFHLSITGAGTDCTGTCTGAEDHEVMPNLSGKDYTRAFQCRRRRRRRRPTLVRLAYETPFSKYLVFDSSSSRLSFLTGLRSCWTPRTRCWLTLTCSRLSCR